MKDKTQQKVWEEIAPYWKKVRTKPRKEVSEFIGSLSGKLLDLGCGSGRHFSSKEELEMYGADFSKKMVTLAKEIFGKDKVKLMENEEIPFENSYFDNIICIAVLHCIESKERRIKFLKESYRVLRKEGKMLVQVWSKNHSRTKGKGNEAIIPWTAGNKTFDRYYYLYELEELKNELLKVGFKVLNAEEDENITLIVTK